MGRFDSYWVLPCWPLLLLLSALGCNTMNLLIVEPSPSEADEQPAADLIQPGDVVWIDIFNAMPEAAHRLQQGDMLHIVVPQALPEEPIDASYLVDASGVVTLGPTYGSIHVAGQTGEQVAVAIAEHLRGTLTNPQVSAEVVFTPRQADAEMDALQEAYSGEHAVNTNGQVTLGSYGSVQVVGMTVDQAARVIEQYTTAVRLEAEIRSQRGSTCTVIIENPAAPKQTHEVELAEGATVRSILQAVTDVESLRGMACWITPPTRIRPGLATVETIEVHDISAESNKGLNQRIFAGDTIHVGEREPRQLFSIPPGQSGQLLQRFPCGNQISNF